VFQNRAEQLLANLGNAYEFSQRARDILSADGYRSPKDDEGPCDFGQMLMLANSGGVWTVGSDFSLTELPADSMWAEGSGRELAIGAAHAIQSAFPEISPEEVIRLAVETAVAKDVGCGGAVWISELNAGRKSAP
jgi:ATP-dependent protease HslVU (ClpYQ) peptidase subunit